MADVETRKAATDEESSEQPGGWWKAAWIRWAAAIVVASLVVHGALFLLLKKSGAPQPAPVEQAVGSFNFVAVDAGKTSGAPAKFDLHIRFVDDLEKSGRQRLLAHQYRVREAVENLLRKTQGVELSDPAVARLKHEIQERIDGAIDLRAVAEVIITNLQIDSPTASLSPAVAIEGASADQKRAEPTGLSVGN
jgi:flagellar basal body-associated protein FliL